MKVYKFGGASIKSADAIRNMCGIIKSASDNNLLVVVSAMGKTTNALEELLLLKREGKPFKEKHEEVKKYHFDILKSLFKEDDDIFNTVENYFNGLLIQLNQDYQYDVHYDQIVSFGELISSIIIQAFLKKEKPTAKWIDARKYIITDDTFREGKVIWGLTFSNIKSELPEILEKNIIITQGFIGGHGSLTTTLGREGSDFSAAIFASGLGAESLTIWKDVPGILSADPSRFKEVELFDTISYQEAAEMTYYGATVIHPKTIKPLANRQIPLWVKSFDNPSARGTVIHTSSTANLPPAIIVKEKQSLIYLTIKDFTFINEENLKLIFHEVSQLNLKINMMQNSALTFSMCVDHDDKKIDQLIIRLEYQFSTMVRKNLKLITIKNYTSDALEKYVAEGKIILEQKTAVNYQALVSPEV